MSSETGIRPFRVDTPDEAIADLLFTRGDTIDIPYVATR